MSGHCVYRRPSRVTPAPTSVRSQPSRKSVKVFDSTLWVSREGGVLEGERGAKQLFVLCGLTVSRAKILGNAELFIKSGSDINLTCLAMQSPVPPSFIYWYKGKRVMNYSQRGGINVITERSTRTSKLLIAKATSADSGNYTCSPSSSGEWVPLSTPPCPSRILCVFAAASSSSSNANANDAANVLILSLSVCQSTVSFYCRWQLM